MSVKHLWIKPQLHHIPDVIQVWSRGVARACFHAANSALQTMPLSCHSMYLNDLREEGNVNVGAGIF